MMRNQSGLRLAMSSDFTETSRFASLSEGDGVFLESLGAAVLRADPDQIRSLRECTRGRPLRIERARCLRASGSVPDCADIVRHLQTPPQPPGDCRPHEARPVTPGAGYASRCWIRELTWSTRISPMAKSFRTPSFLESRSMIPTVTEPIVREYCAVRSTPLRDPATGSPPTPLCISPRCWTIRPTVPTATFSQASTGQSGTVALSSPCHSVRPCSRALPILGCTRRSLGVRSPPEVC